MDQHAAIELRMTVNHPDQRQHKRCNAARLAGDEPVYDRCDVSRTSLLAM
jgi:hypothetical protein